jgi:Zn-dependent protease
MDKRVIYVIIAGIVIMGLLGFTQEKLLTLVLTLPGLLIAITFHEFAHAFVADKLGDDTPRQQGRLNLNPLSHLDPVGSMLLLFAGFGWGKPVEVNPRNFDRKLSMETGNALVSIAGPVTNFILAFVFAIIYGLLIKLNPAFILFTELGQILGSVIIATITINIGLGVFNLIPLPPLDGSKIFIRFMPYNVKNWIYNNEQILYIIFLVIWVTGIAGYIVSPINNAITNGILFVVNKLFGLF